MAEPALDDLFGRDADDRSRLCAKRRDELDLADKIEAELRQPPLPRWTPKSIREDGP